MAKCVASKALMALELLRMLVVFASSKVDKSATRLRCWFGQPRRSKPFGMGHVGCWLVGWSFCCDRRSSFFSRIAARKKANLKMNYIISGKSKWRDKIVSNEWKRLKQLISRHTGSYVVYTPCACVFVIPVIEFPWQHHFNLMILYENLHETAILCESKNN